MSEIDCLAIFIYCGLTLFCYQLLVKLQKKIGAIWLNPVVLSIISIILVLTYLNVSFDTYFHNTQIIHHLLEPAIVVLGFPLYQQLQHIKKEFKEILFILTVAIIVMLVVSFSISIWLIQESNIAISLSLKSITTAIGIALTAQFNGVVSITTFAIIIAGLTGAVVGIKWLNFLGLTHPKAQGLAVGCASHALGTITISHLSNKHAAYSALALILSAIITAIISPFIIPFLINFLA